jgi:SagB-type dehydrogenase family enzyme
MCSKCKIHCKNSLSVSVFEEARRMNLDEFLYQLHFDIEKVSPPDWKVDWEDAPLSYKLYDGLPVVPFSLEVPLTLEKREAPSSPDRNNIGHFLWYVYGHTQFSQSVYTTDPAPELMEAYRRFVPSGGALYPNELYVYLKLKDLPLGVYQYDVAHHRLVLLREGNFDTYLSRALGNRCDLSTCFATVFVSTMFWKNFYKYNNFSYRLQGLDAGVLMGQLLEVAKRFGFETGVFYQFLDQSINHLLGLSDHEESVYSVIPLSVEPTIWSTLVSDQEGTIHATNLIREITAIQPKHYVRSKRIKPFPMLTRINEASMYGSSSSFRYIIPQMNRNGDGYTVVLPDVKKLPYDLATACRQRFSPDMDFTMIKVSQQQLATLLHEATDSFSYRNDLDMPNQKFESRVSLYGCFSKIEGIQDGAYYYDSEAHVLRQLTLGDHRLKLQLGMSGSNVNLFQVPICFHVVGEKDHMITALGYRGYRIQQMEAGMLIQRLLLTASVLGLGGHPLLGFKTQVSDEIYKIHSQEKTSLIQLPIGPYRNRPWLSGGLHS